MSGYKYIKQPTTLIPVEQGAWDFKRFVSWLIDNDHRFNSSGRGIRAGSRIEGAISEKVLRLTTEDHRLLSEAANGPTLRANGQFVETYPTARGRLWLPFVEVIDAASDEAPPSE